MLADWNSRWSRPGLAGPLSLLVCVAASLFLIGQMHRKQTLDQPPEVGGDALDYDLIAWGLSTGEGYTRAPESPTFLAPYVQGGHAPPIVPFAGPVTDRPPLYPLVLAATFRAGRQFHVIRIGQAIVMGLVLAAMARVLYARAGLVPALLCSLLFLVIDPRPRTMVREILTESLACGLVTLLLLLLMQWDRRRRLVDAILVGGTLGLLVMCRTMMVAWIPFLGCGMWFLTDRPERGRAHRQAVVMAAVAIAVCVPWWVRTVTVLGEFRPLGTQGAEQFSAAYSDEAFQRLGMWYNLDEAGFFEGIKEPDPVRRTLERVERSEQAARKWVVQHPLKAAMLWPARVFQELRPHGPGDLFVLAFAALGLAVVWKIHIGRVARWLLAGQLFAIAATWSVAGRFLFPLLGILHLLAAIGLWGAYLALVEKRDISREWVLRPVERSQ